MATSILWFRRDLRLNDNQALNAALEDGNDILPVYVIDELDAGGASRWWLHHSLASLRTSLHRYNAELLILSGDPVEHLLDLVDTCDATRVVCSARYEEAARAQEDALDDKLPDGVSLVVTANYLVNEPNTVCTQSGDPYKVFTPFYKAAKKLPAPDGPGELPSPIRSIEPPVESDSEAFENLLPTPNWADSFDSIWTPGEDGAQARVDNLSNIASDYGDERDRPDHDGTSRLSPHLHFGEVSVNTVWHRLQRIDNSEPLLRQLYWRDFSYQLLSQYPKLSEKPLREEFEKFPWRDDKEGLKRWQKGQTGYPIVDAGMRQLWNTGWMHNRVRMITASFLVKHLLIHWKHGAAWFVDTLVDADPANNSAGWQWVAGCGTDAAPYFRIFNPILQGEKFDPLGDYVREWVPELERLPKKFIHEPWTADEDELKSCNVVLGEDYPKPIVDHKTARQRALDAYDEIKD